MNWNREAIESLARKLGEARGEGYPPLTLDQLAEVTGVSKGTLCRIQTGALSPGVKVQERLAKAWNS